MLPSINYKINFVIKMNNIILLSAILFLSANLAHAQIIWNTGDWAHACDFNGRDLGNPFFI